MKKLYILFFLILSIGVFAQDYQALFKKATDLYQKKEYDSAITTYKKILNQHPHNAILHYNLANVYQQQKDTLWAVFHYEKALKYQPDMKSARVNLQYLYLNKNKIEKFEMNNSEIFYSLFNFWNTATWAVMSIVFAILSLVFFLLRYTHKIDRKILNITIFISMPLAFVFYGITKNQKYYITANQYAIVSKPVVLKSAQRDFSTNLKKLPKATKVFLISSENQWSFVKLSDGTKGWVEKKNLLDI